MFHRRIGIGVVSLSLLASLLIACQSDPANRADQSAALESAIEINQLGFAPTAHKEALVPAGVGDRFELVDVDTQRVVFSGTLSKAERWPVSGQTVRRADFSEYQRPGRYRLRVAGELESIVFPIEEGVYAGLNDAAVKAYYFNRASTALEQSHAGVYARPAGHPDDQVMVHQSAASEERPEGTVISSPKGWYDAGDYNKYIVNSGISTYTLLAAYEHFPQYYRDRDLNIPESGDSVPDLLDEAMWNLDWMLTMQDPNDGGVYHKLTTLRFAGKVMPEDATAQRYVVQKGTSAALNFAAVMATASRVYGDYSDAFPGFSERAMAAAELAWAWAQAHPDVTYRNPSDVATGEYGDQTLTDEFVWAAVELYLTSGDQVYLESVDLAAAEVEVPSWGSAVGQPWLSLLHFSDELPAELKALAEGKVTELANALTQEWQQSASGVPMRPQDFVWGSNGVAMNSAMMLLSGYQLTGDDRQLAAAQSLLDYVLGRNPTGFSYVTGEGVKTPMHIHHRPSAADGIDEPVPGFLAGGPHSGQQDLDDCPVAYPSDQPARSYLDHWCSYSTNEITINWNAPLVYVTGALEVIYQQDH
ncbi:glycoside hydrolase family 9 protein [Marinimicrobium sp. ARAG 43.8]|uniref:glycoside hydrolase family 9 protein n=1 Tax=Marinimicrobium sp. ARAG 43.8 TaxID=3418719 RepID=UPI003CEE38C8